MAKAKAKQKEVVVPLHLLPFVSDDKDVLIRRLFGCEMSVYNYYMETTQGAVEKVAAFVLETKELKADGDAHYNAYVKAVKAIGKKYAVGFEIILPTDKDGDLDEL